MSIDKKKKKRCDCYSQERRWVLSHPFHTRTPTGPRDTEHRMRRLRWVPEGPMTGGAWRERAGWIYSPLRLPGPSAERQKHPFRSQRHNVCRQTTGTPPDGETKQIQTVQCVCHMSPSVALKQPSTVSAQRP